MSKQEFSEDNEYSLKHYFVPITTKKIIHFLIIIGILVFANSLLNPFIFDDLPQIVQNEKVHSLTNLPEHFVHSLAFPGAHPGDLLHIYFKPILFSTYTLIYSLFGTWVFPFHLLHLFLHIGNAILIFFLFKKFIKFNLAFLLSLLFLIHPLNSEAVIYIANLQDVLFTFFGLIALLVISTKRALSHFKLCIIFLALLCSILSKETGILFFFFVSLWTFLYKRNAFKTIALIVTGSLLIALLMRFNASFHATPIMSFSLMQYEPLWTRILSIPEMFFYYLSHFIIPLNLATGQEWIVRDITFQNFYLPLLVLIIFVIASIAFGLMLYRKEKRQFTNYLFFAVWFYMGIGIHMQLIPLDMTVADRWFYFPMIGLLGCIGIIGTNYLTFSKLQICVLATIIVILSALTMHRNAQWQNPFSLYQHDIQYARVSPAMASYYGALLIEKKEYKEAEKQLTQSVSTNPAIGSNLINLAVLYEHKKQYQDAKKLYEQNIKQNTVPSYTLISYQSLARLELIQGKNSKQAKVVAEEGLQKYQSDIQLTQYLAIAEYLLGNKKEAEKIIQTLYQTYPTEQIMYLYTLIKTDRLTLEALVE